MLERSYFLHNKIERTTFASNKRKQPECLKYRREYARNRGTFEFDFERSFGFEE